MPNAQQDLLTDHRRQPELDLDEPTRTTATADTARTRPGNPQPDPTDPNATSAPALTGDWSHNAEPAPRRPLNGYQPELLPCVPAGRSHE